MTGLGLISFADADYASRSTGRRSVSGGVVMCAGGPVSWHSKTQKFVTLWTYSPLLRQSMRPMSNMGKEILFSRQVWCFMLLKARMPRIAMYEDNEGAIQNRKAPDFHLELEAH